MNILVFTGTLSVVAIALCIGMVIHISRVMFTVLYYPNKTSAIKQGATFSFIVAFLACLMWLLLIVAHFKGMQPETTDVNEFFTGLTTTPFEDTIPEDDEDLMGKLFVYYRYDCPQCHTIMDEVQEALKDYPVYYVCSRSEQGIRLRELYPVSSVPTIVYTRANVPERHYSAPLAIQDGDSGVMLDTEALTQILKYYENQY